MTPSKKPLQIIMIYHIKFYVTPFLNHCLFKGVLHVLKLNCLIHNIFVEDWRHAEAFTLGVWQFRRGLKHWTTKTKLLVSINFICYKLNLAETFFIWFYFSINFRVALHNIQNIEKKLCLLYWFPSGSRV